MRAAYSWCVPLIVLAGTMLLGHPARAAGSDDQQRWAIIIGVQRYPEAKGFSPLRYAERDAQDLYDLLVDPQRGGYAPDHVKLLTTAAEDPERLPVRGNVLAALNRLADQARAAAQAPEAVLIYFAGHGLSDSGRSYLIPSDASRDDLAATAISLEEMRRRLERCGAKQQVIILDSCRLQAKPGRGPGDEQSIEFARQLEALGRARGRVVMASCSQNEASYDDDERRHGAFTSLLLQGLEGPADANSDGFVSVTELHEYVAREMDTWARQRDLKQTPQLYGEFTLTVPLVRCPQWADLRITSVPAGAQVWIDGRDTGKQTPYGERVKLEGTRQRVVRVVLRKVGFDDLAREVALSAGSPSAVDMTLAEQPRPATRVAPGLKPAAPGWAARTFYANTGYVNGLAVRPDGALLVTIASPHVVPPGIYVAAPEDECDPGDVYTHPGAPLTLPEGVLLHPDGRVFVSDPTASTVWVIPAPGAPPQEFTKAVPEPHDLLLAPAGFDGPQVKPGDLIVAAGGGMDPTAGGLYVIDAKSGAVQRLTGPLPSRNGFAHAAFGPDGTLYAMENDRSTKDGITIVSVSPQGQVTPLLSNLVVRTHAPQAGPLAVDPQIGDVYFGYESTIYRMSRDAQTAETFATGGGSVTGLAFAPGGRSLFASDLGAQQVVELHRVDEAAPTIVEVSVARVREAFPPAVLYRSEVTATLRDRDGADDIARVRIVDPAGEVTIQSAADTALGDWTRVDDRTVRVYRVGTNGPEGANRAQPPPLGAYTITAVDREGNETSVITPAAPSVDDSCPEQVSPAPGEVVDAAVPVFRWKPFARQGAYQVLVWEDGDGQVIWQYGLQGTEARYNEDGKALVSELRPGHPYVWMVQSYTTVATSADGRARVVSDRRSLSRFWVYEPQPERPPALRGKLAYSLQGPSFMPGSVFLYASDPRIRPSLLPEGESPSWSPDGRWLLYTWGDAVPVSPPAPSVWLDRFDGSQPVAVPSPGGPPGGDCRWGPDGRRIAALRRGPWTPFWYANLDLWISDVDGSHAYPIADSIEYDERYPAWSPDGEWIAYRRQGYRPGESEWTWLVRYDGTAAHPLRASGVVGYAGYAVTALGEAAWSPDAEQIAVLFWAAPIGPDGAGMAPRIGGIGVLPREGGAVRPVFVSSDTSCCRGPDHPLWSPDGAWIAFASGHHLPRREGPQPTGAPLTQTEDETRKRQFWEPGIELWMVRADGPGAPVRLTYDHMYVSDFSWWAPNTEPGRNVRIVKGDATLTFSQVTKTGSTGLYVFDELPGPPPAGVTFLRDHWEAWSDAGFTGPIGLEIHYNDAGIPENQRSTVALYQWQTDHWADITVRPVGVAHRLLRGTSTDLSSFAIGYGP